MFYVTNSLITVRWHVEMDESIVRYWADVHMWPGLTAAGGTFSEVTSRVEDAVKNLGIDPKRLAWEACPLCPDPNWGRL